MSRVFFVSCFESSGDAIGMLVVQALRREFGADCRFFGIAGPLMQAEGVESWVTLESLNIMGISAVLRAAPKLLRLVKQFAARIDQLAPDAIVTIDAPDFHIRLIEKLCTHHCPRAQLVSPSVWAWRAGRARRFAQAFDAMYCILPFEPQWYAGLSVHALYVGHPSVVMAAQETLSAQDFAAKFGDNKVISLLPGSRNSELKRLKEDFLILKHRIESRVSEEITWLLPTLECHCETLAGWFEESTNPVYVICEPAWRFAAMRYSHAAICCIGTVELELSLRQCPHIALYRFKPIDFFLKNLFRFTIQHGALSNILMGREVIPEYLQSAINHDRITEQVLQLLDSESPEHQRQLEAMHDIQVQLSSPQDDFASTLSKDLGGLIRSTQP